MSAISAHKRRLSGDSDDDDEWQPSSRLRYGSSDATITTTQTMHPPTRSFQPASFTSMFPPGPFVALILPRVTHFPFPAFPPPPPPAAPLAQPAAQPRTVPAASHYAAASSSSHLIDVEDVDGATGDDDLERAIAASLMDSIKLPVTPSAQLHQPASPPTPPSPSGSVVLLDADDDECMVVDASKWVSSSPVSSSVERLPLSPSRWGALPVDVLALICGFQFGGSGGASGHGGDGEDDETGNGLYGGYHAPQYPHHRPFGRFGGTMQVAPRPYVRPMTAVKESNQRPDDALVSIRLLLTMSSVCSHWNTAVRPSEHNRQHSSGCREVDCWSGVQQLQIRQSSKFIHVGGMRVRRKHVPNVLSSLNRLRSLHMEFNVDQSAMDECNFTLLLPGSSIVSAYPQLKHLKIELINCWVHRPRSKPLPPPLVPYQSPRHELYAELSAWLDCHPNLRSFTLIDRAATLAAYVPPFIFMPPPLPPPPPPRAPRMQLARRGRRAALVRAPVAPAVFAPVPPPQPVIPRPPAVPQPTAAALRLLCSGRLQHLALAGETALRLAYGDDAEDEEMKGDEKADSDKSSDSFHADGVKSVALVGNWTQPRYAEALYKALPSLTLLTLANSQTERGLETLLVKLGQRVTFLRLGCHSLIDSTPGTLAASCTALQSLYIRVNGGMATELAQIYALLPSLPSLTQLSVVEQAGSQRYPSMHELAELLLPPLPNLIYLHLQLSSYRAFPLVANRAGRPGTILPAKLTHLLLSIPGQQLVPHLSSLPLLCPNLARCHINSGVSVTAQTWEARLGRLKGRLGRVWCDSAEQILRCRLDMAWRVGAGLDIGVADEWEGATW